MMNINTPRANHPEPIPALPTPIRESLSSLVASYGTKEGTDSAIPFLIYRIRIRRKRPNATPTTSVLLFRYRVYTPVNSGLAKTEAKNTLVNSSLMPSSTTPTTPYSCQYEFPIVNYRSTANKN